MPKEQLMLGNSAMSTGRGLANSMGFFAGGVLIAAFGYDIAFYIDSASFLISAVMIAIIALPHLPAATGKSLRENVAVVLNNMRDGWAYVSRHRAARVLFATVFILFLCGGAYNMMEAAFVGKTLGGGTGGFGLVSGVMTPSFLTGTILFGGMAHRLNPFNTFSWGALGMGLSVLAFASSPNLAVAVGLAALFGLVYVGFAQETLHFSVRLTLQSMGLIAVAGGFLALWLYWRERQGAAKEEVPAAGV
ncbi:MAG: MFS transporter [Firmicutes bacterium]|nr:MFS transporter [Bacillota bacterium]